MLGVSVCCVLFGHFALRVITVGLAPPLRHDDVPSVAHYLQGSWEGRFHSCKCLLVCRMSVGTVPVD